MSTPPLGWVEARASKFVQLHGATPECVTELIREVWNAGLTAAAVHLRGVTLVSQDQLAILAREAQHLEEMKVGDP